MDNAHADQSVDEKIGQLQAEIEKARRLKSSPQLPALLKKLGQAYLEAGKAAEALVEFNEAVKLVAASGNHEAESQIMGYQGMAYRQMGNFPLAMQCFQKSNQVAVQIHHAQLACDSYIQIAALESDAGKYKQAIDTLLKARNSAQNQADPARKMLTCSLLGDNYYRLKTFDRAAEYYRLAAETARELGNRSAECSFMFQVGNIYLLKRKLPAALAEYENALALATEIGDRYAELSILGGLFRAFALGGDTAGAADYGRRAVELAGQVNLPEAEITNIKVLAGFLVEDGRAYEAIPLLEKGFQTAVAQDNLVWQMDLAEKLGFAWHSLENHHLALENYNISLEAAARLQDRPAECLVLGRLGLLQAESGDLEGSIRSAEKALALASELENHELAAEQQILLAFNHRDCGRPEKAREYCQAAVETYQRLEDAPKADQARELLAELAG